MYLQGVVKIGVGGLIYQQPVNDKASVLKKPYPTFLGVRSAGKARLNMKLSDS